MPLANQKDENEMRQILSLAFLSLLPCNVAFADMFKSEEQLKPFAESVMTKVGKGELDAAFGLMKPFVVVPETEFDSLVAATRAEREKVGSRYGKSVGFECVGQRKVGQSLVRVTCIEKTEKHALPWLFYFYKTPGGWALNSFGWNDKLPSLFSCN